MYVPSTSYTEPSFLFFFSSRRRHTRSLRDWSSDVCSSDLIPRLYIAASCGPCSELRRWLAARRPTGIEILDAEMLPSGSIRRMRYDPADGSATVDGIRAFGRALEHLHLGWALAGAAMRLPLLWQSIQVVMDASGLGPRRLPTWSSTGAVPSHRQMSSRGPVQD